MGCLARVLSVFPGAHDREDLEVVVAEGPSSEIGIALESSNFVILFLWIQMGESPGDMLLVHHK
jgi:hypothetical protein